MIAYHSRTTGILCTCFVLFFAACSTSKRGLFTKQTAHEQYASRLTDAGLAGSALGSLWFAAAEKALARPLSITLPYKETGYFAAEKPDAAGYLFPARRGDVLKIVINGKATGSFKIFADLWQPAAANEKTVLLAAADTTSWTLLHEVKSDGRFLLRLQPELLRSGEYTVTITTAPSLAFPVPGSTQPRIGSFWGANRDGGSRSHEGIDIFGKFRTPVISAANGFISSTRENKLGGRVIFLNPDGKPYSLYYAHLDSVLVREGQKVKLGDTIGLMGNTGNARNTATHLHFGIYTNGGAIDPLPFVNRDRPAPAEVTAATALLQHIIRNTSATSLLASPVKNSTLIEKLPANRVMQVMAATGSWYKVTLPDSREGFVESKTVSAQPYKKQLAKNATPLLDAPDTTAAVKITIPAGADMDILGEQGTYRFITYGEQKGWVQL